MMDDYLHQQNFYYMAHAEQQNRLDEDISSNRSLSHSWVMLDNEGKPVCLPQEQFVLELGGRIACEIKPTERRRWPEPLPNKSASGKLYLSNKRVLHCTLVFFSRSSSALIDHVNYTLLDNIPSNGKDERIPRCNDSHQEC